MKTCFKYELPIALGACLLVSIGNSTLADEPAETKPATSTPDTSTWACKLCPVSTGWFGGWDLGLISVSDESLKFGDYRGLDEDSIYLAAGGDSSFRNEEGLYFDFYGRDLGLDSRALEMRGGKQGKYEFRANYSEIPRYLGYSTQSPYLGVGTNTLTLPQPWTYDQETLEQSLLAVPLESSRETYGAGLTFKSGNSWKYEVNFERQTRDGTRAFSGGLFALGAAIFPAPVDYTTDQFDMGIVYTGKRGQLRLGFAGSDFDNGSSSVTWDNPFDTGFGDAVSRSALEPDNEFYQFSLAGAFRFTPRFRVSGKASFGEMEQNEAFLPYSINPRYEDLELPRNNLDGKIESSMFNLSGRLYIRLADRLDLTAQYKVNDRDNQTPVDIYTPVLLEVFRLGEHSNRPYSYKRTQEKLELRFRTKNRLRFNAGLKRDTMERSHQSVSETDEDSFWGEIQFSPWAWMDARLKLENLERDSTPYEQLADNGRAENPLMRKFHLAERDRDRATIEVDLMPTDRFGVNLSYYTTEDDYDASVIGLTGSEEESYSVDFNFILNEKANIYAFANRDEIESEMSGAVSVDASPWNAFTEDTVKTWGIGFSGRVNGKVSYGLDYVSSDSDGEILTNSGAGEAPFPVLMTELTNTRIYLDYKLNDRWTLGLDAYREEYVSSDWYIDDVGPASISSVLTMGGTSPDYEVNAVSLLAKLKF